ncbi:MAG: HYR domain-containing protein [Saprospiraceae bacterium]
MQAQYSESFGTADKGYKINCSNDFGGMIWTLTSWNTAGTCQTADLRDPTDYFNTTAAGKLECIDLDEEVCWESPLINTAAANPVSLKMDLSWVGFDVDIAAGGCFGDYIKVFYSVNGGAYTLVPNVKGGNPCATVAYPFSGPPGPFNDNVMINHVGITGGGTLRIKVCVLTNANAELVTIDNVEVPEAGVTLNCNQPVLNTTVKNIVCNGPNSGSIDLSVSGGTPGYTYDWSNDGAEMPDNDPQDLSGLAIGTYTVTVTDAASCSQTAAASIISAPITQSAIIYPASCGLANGAIDLTPSGGNQPYSYTWTGGANTQDISSKLAGTYTVTVTDASSPACTSTATYVIGTSADGPYSETFSIINKGYLTNQINNFFGVNWTMSPWTLDEPVTGIGRDNGDSFSTTASGKLETSDTDQEICWISPELNISSSGTVQFSVDIAWNGIDDEDYISVQYSINGGSFVVIPNVFGGGVGTIQYAFPSVDQISSTTVTKTGITGNKLQIRVCILTNSQADIVTIDNVNVPQTISYCFAFPPVITCPTNKVANNELNQCYAAQSFVATATGTDPIVFTYSQASGSNFNVGVTTVTATATNIAGMDDCMFTVTINDTQLPIISCPGNLNFNNGTDTCGKKINFVTPIGTDNCGGATNIQTTGLASGSVFPVGTTTNTFKVTDASNNTATCSFTITINDTQLPIISCPGNLNFNNGTDTCGKKINFVTPTGTDNCAGATNIQTSGLASGSVFPVGTTTNTFKVTDANSNTATCSFTITINDTQNPIISCPGNLNFNNGTDTCGKKINFVTPTGTDNCAGATNLQTAGLASGSVFPVGTTTNTFKVTDANSNTASCSFTITINDTQNPVISCPGNLNFSNGTDSCAKKLNFLAPIGTDNCAGVTTSQTSGLASGSVFPIGTTTNTFKVTDASNNTATCSFTITINDTQIPTIVCPANIVTNNGLDSCGKKLNYIAPIGTDNCGSATTMQIAGLVSGSVFPIGVNTISYKATDANGNTNSCSFTITINEVDKPTISCTNASATATVGQCSAIVCYASPVMSDNCLPSTPVGYTYKASFGNSRYYQSNGLTNFSTAFNNAKTAGAHLAVISSAAENAAIASSGAGFSWIGGNDFVTNGVWKWDNCEAYAYSNFCVGEPNGGTSENHLEFQTGGCWNDLNTSALRYSIIEIEGAKLTQTAGLAQNASFPVGQTINIFEATDASGNTASCSMTVTVFANSCKYPIQVYHRDTTTNSAKIKWKAQTGTCSTGGLYELRIRWEISPGVWSTWSAWANKTGPSLEHNFTGLDADRFFHYQIRTICGTSTSTAVNGWFHTLPGGSLRKEITDLKEENGQFENHQTELNGVEIMPLKLQFVPNPSNDFTELYIQGFEKVKKEVMMFDLNGKLVFRVIVSANQNNLGLDFEKLKVHSGIYLIRVSDGTKQKTEQLMIEK